MQNNKSNSISEHGVSVEEAVARLRMRIKWDRYATFWKMGTAIKMAIKTIFYAAILLLLEFFLIYWLFGNPILFTLTFIAGNVVLIINFGFGMWKEFVNRSSKDSLLIGRSFSHAAQSANADGRRKSVNVGRDGMHYVDYIHQPNHHMLINGSTSSGKTVTMLTIAARASLVNGINFLMIDWNGENEDWARSVGATVWKVPDNFKINLFKLNGMRKEVRASMAIESLVVAARLTPLQSTKIKSALLKFYVDGAEPSLFDLWNALCSKDTGKANVLNQRLRAIQRVIGYEPEEFWQGIFIRNNLISLAGLNESEKSLIVYSIVQRISELFDKSPELNSRLRLMVVMDEAWQFFKREREFDAHRESSLEKVVRLGRKYGFGLVVSTQQIEDVPKVFINSCSLVMLHQQREYNYYGKDIMELCAFESAYLKSAAQGEMLLFDRGTAQEGRFWPEYVKVQPLSSDEAISLAGMFKSYTPNQIFEPEMPIEMYDNGYNQVVSKTGRNGILEKLDIPSVAVYRFMVALSRTTNLTEAYKFLREKTWLTSKASLYGGLGKPSILARAQGGGYVTGDGKLTERGLDVIDTERLVAKQGILSGSEEHKNLMKKTIMMVQDNGNFAFTLDDKDSFDIGEIKAKTKSSWDFDKLTAYECQTNAIKEEINKCIERSRRLNGRLIFVAGQDVSQSIINIVGNKFECRSF